MVLPFYPSSNDVFIRGGSETVATNHVGSHGGSVHDAVDAQDHNLLLTLVQRHLTHCLGRSVKTGQEISLS